ncbi:MAG: TIGR02301 family protein [Pseudolabrys sp.]|nr:TIGR02301 family protein [Pseudolabrys sp.]
MATLLGCLGVPVLGLAVLAPPVQAQEKTPEKEQESTPAPFDKDLQRLAEILGSLQYLRTVCGANEGQKWRNEMQALIDAEAPSGDRRRQIVARFNRGYRGFEQTYRTCTPAADLAIRRYLDEGAKIARDITARYGN